MHHLDHDIDEFDEDYKSKTDVKREMHELQEFALNMIRLPKVKRKKLPLNEELQDAMVLADKIINKPEPLRRHCRFIAKILLETGTEEIQKSLDAMANKHQQQTMQQEKFELLREKLIDEGADAIEALLAECDSMERQKLRQLVRQAAKEKKSEKPAKGYRDLLAYIKEHNS
ncbi:ribosome biogenesis factor YjgA [Thalassotalea euphylliae]|uniref:ribosome biogenesis factor YjgA n=1 Tax=Thalassotalea euphylliae TaxID=1655234 RepID=UPI00362A4FC1